MGRIGCVIRKEFQQLRRDRRMLPIVFIAPVFQLLVLGYAANLDVRDIPTAVYDLDHSRESRELVDRLFQSEYFRAAAYVEDYVEFQAALQDGRAELGIVVPSGFGKRIASGGSAPLQLVSDGSQSSEAIIALNYASIIVARYGAAAGQRVLQSAARGGEAPDPVRSGLRARVWFNPELKSRNFMVPGILAMLLMIMTMMLTSLAVVREKESGTLEQLIVSPIRPLQLITGKLLPFSLLGVFDIILVLLVARFLFGILIAGSVLLLFALSCLFLLSTLGLGLLISTVSHTQQQAMVTSIFFVMLPMIILSGFVFPIENMPRVIRWAAYLLPLRYYFVVVRGIFLKGVGLAELWDEALVLFVLGAVILTLSVLRFHKRLE